ncbi:uncharacterized protein M421DRAFT_425511 [Didymella exigua CBS 183.55]|uniref:U4/U6.U5 small nuclear ribonucleoprotein 27kDa protein domain-containing protein n=1 Tax=Didymella exigua CBS 183.55 TaxID=1150837 RepID=A0A6A5R869_9PLEO|nr:uncharacterized protein M421DRAFT_425511 [Didymella exigua CBS 183.55]KAF1923813.1 hypothetical protein M421DRAFT_425511 [Didymella exigua CBS 183.55]
MSDTERRREPHRDKHNARGARERDGATERSTRSRPARSRSPRADGGRREGRYRSRSPARREVRGGRGHDGRGRGGRTNDRNNDRTSHAPPRAPRAIRPEPVSSSAKAVSPEAMEVETKTEMKTETKTGPQDARPEDMDDETWAVMQTMGFGGFKSTKNTKVPGNAGNYGVRRDKTMEARQYMNRQGGFNRPLSPGRG